VGRAQILLVLLIGVPACNSRRNEDRTYEQAAQDYFRGDLGRAAETAARFAKNRPQSQRDWHWLLLDAEIAIARGDGRKALAALAEPVPAQFPNEELRRKIDLVNALIKSRRAREARSILDQAKAALQPATPSDLRFQAEILDGMLKAPTEAAEQIFGRVLSEATRANDQYTRATALINLAFCRSQHSRFENAAEFGEQAVAAAEKAQAKRLLSAALLNLGLSYSRLGQFESALERLRRSSELAESVQDPALLMNSIGEQGNLFMFQGEPAKAAEPYRRSFDIAKRTGSNPVAAMWAGNLARALIDVSQWDEAERWNNVAIELTGAADQRSRVYLESNTAIILNARGDRRGAEVRYRDALANSADYPELEWGIHSSLGSIYRQEGNVAKANREFERALDLIEKRWSAISNDRFRITFLDRLIRFYQSYVDVLVTQGQLKKALQVAERSRARILAERVGTPQVPSGGDFQPEALARAAGGVLLSYWLAPARSFVWAVTPAGIHLEVLPQRDEIAALVSAYRDSLEEWMQDSLDRPSGRKLYEILLKPVERWIPPKSRVLVVPDGVLHQVNLETLPVPSPQPHYWIEDVTLSVVPSLTVLKREPHSSQTAVLLIGAPLPAGDRYPALTNANAEIASIRSRFDPSRETVFQGAQATPDSFLNSQPERYSIIHFAAHAEANRESPLDSAVILSPGKNGFKLYAHELINRKLQANLVTISACRSAGARSYSGEGLIGFAWAFLQAGAKDVVAGLWDVPDESTSDLMKNFYDGIAQGHAPPEALRMAKLALIHSGTAYRRPFYWAPFQTYIRVAS
jgi:CHAT domain-containing protein/Tfp pilus assembly protein PilF